MESNLRKWVVLALLPPLFYFVFNIFGIQTIWTWWGCLVASAITNSGAGLAFYFHFSASSSYEWWAKHLAIPMVWECAYRGILPSLYLQRYTFWDVWANSIVVDRTFACFGEIAWISQVALCLRHVDKELSGTGQTKRLTWYLSWAAVVICVVAEGTSYYNIATTNELWCAIEVGLWGVAWALLFPTALGLTCKCPGSLFSSSGKAFCVVLAITSVVYPAYNFLVDCPMYMARYRADQAAGKQYFEFWPGLLDAATRRVPTRGYSDWKDDMFWMVAYFSVASLSSILMMAAPKVNHDNNDGKMGRRMGLRLSPYSQLASTEEQEESASECKQRGVRLV